VSKAVAASFVLLGVGAIAMAVFIVIGTIVWDGRAGEVVGAALGVLAISYVGWRFIRHGLRYWRASSTSTDPLP
jgi:hypothetical protein